MWKLSATQLIQHITVLFFLIIIHKSSLKVIARRLANIISRIKVTAHRTHNSEET